MSALPPKADIGTLHVYHLLRSNSGGFAIFAAIRHALPFVSISLAAERRPGSSSDRTNQWRSAA
jgi:hypothetical protein